MLIREGKPSEVIRYITDYRLQMIWYIYFMSDMDTRPMPPGLRGAGLTTVLMGEDFQIWRENSAENIDIVLL